MRLVRATILGFLAVGLYAEPALAKEPANCPKLDLTGDKPLAAVTIPPAGACKVQTKSGFTFPDPSCTPGAVNPALTLQVLKKKTFKTGCERDLATNPDDKKATYGWYNVTKPANNREPHMICELDHLISIEIGGADTLDNIWPQCGPKGSTGANRYFKQKDMVENYLAAQVRAGKMELKDVQSGIATDWTQYLDDAKNYYKTHKQRNNGG